eukprot:11185735-Lingulodinium_polyedra.AAC.1
MANIESSYHRMGPCPADLACPEGALREFLQSSSVYAESRRDVAPYAEDFVSWPEGGSQPVSV